MSDMREDAEALADVLRRLDGEGFNWSYLGSNDLNTDDGWRDVKDLARAVLASDWLAAHDARVRAEALAPIEEVRRRIVQLHPDMLGWCQGCAHESYPCRTLLALGDLRAAMEAKG